MTASTQYLFGKEPFRIGVSYWPQQSGLAMWKHFDVDEIHEDFANLSELGINLARITLLWEDFQPEPDSIRCSALAHLLELCDAAASESVRLELLLFGGQLGQLDGFPDWLREMSPLSTVTDAAQAGGSVCGLVNPFSNPTARSAATTLVRGIARTVGGHPAIWAYNLGDRPDRLAPHCCRIAANSWFEDLRQTIHAVDTKHPVTCSLGHRNLSTNDMLRVDEVFSRLDHSTIAGDDEHLYLDNPAAQGIFSCALTTALTGKRCMLQQPSRTLPNSSADSDEALAISTSTLLEGLHRIGAMGTVIGTFSDLPDDPNAGLVSADGTARPKAGAVQEFARTKRFVEHFPTGRLKLGVTANEYYEQPGVHMKRLYGEFFSG